LKPTGHRRQVVKDIKEQDVYHGRHSAHDRERHLRRQRHRARHRFPDAPFAGRVLRPRQGQDARSGKLLFAARVIPYRGSWLDFEFDAKDIMYVRIDRRRKLPATTLLYALGMSTPSKSSHLLQSLKHKRRRGWTTKYNAERWRGVKPTVDLVDAKTGKVVAEAGKKITPRLANKLVEDGVKELLCRRRPVRPLHRRRHRQRRKPAKSTAKPATS
jgi:DNA-directed RNA polymerase subunit beta